MPLLFTHDEARILIRGHVQIVDVAGIRGTQAAAHRRDGVRAGNAHDLVDAVDAVIAEIRNVAARVIREDPVIGEEAHPVEGRPGRWPEVEIPVEPGRRIGVRNFLLDVGSDVPAVPHTHEGDIADLARLDHARRLGDVRRRPVLGARVENPFRAPGGLHHGAPFPNGERERLLHVNVLACFEAQHRGNGVPVIGSGHHHGIHFLDLEHPAKVAQRFRAAAGQIFRSALRVGIVHVAGRQQLRVRRLQQAAHDLPAAPSTTDQSHDYTVVCAENPACGKSRPRRGCQEITPFHKGLQRYLYYCRPLPRDRNLLLYRFLPSSLRFLAQSSLFTWRARPTPNASAGTSLVMTDPAAT